MNPASAYSTASVIHARIMKEAIANVCFVRTSISIGANHRIRGTATQSARPIFTRSDVSTSRSGAATTAATLVAIGSFRLAHRGLRIPHSAGWAEGMARPQTRAGPGVRNQKSICVLILTYRAG